MKKNKKGISPLIATVLLIGFTVALAAMIISWANKYVRGTTSESESDIQRALKCAQDLNFKVTNISCGGATGGAKSISVENNGLVDIKSVIVRTHYDNGTIITNETALLTGISKYNVATFTVRDIGSSTNKVDVIAVLPGEAGEKDIACMDAMQTFVIDC